MSVKERTKLIRELKEAKTDARGIKPQLTREANRVDVLRERLNTLIERVDNLDKEVDEHESSKTSSPS